MTDNYPFYLANEAHQPNSDLEVTDKYTGEVATRVALADAPDELTRRLPRHVAAAEPMRRLRPTSGKPSWIIA